MELIFLGTGAAEGVPAVYCRCAVCQSARLRGGKEIRTRSSLRVGPHHQIDISPENCAQMIRAGTDMYDIEHVLVTHTHADHFAFSALMDKGMSRTTNGKPISVHLSEPAKRYLEESILRLSLSDKDRRWIGDNLALNGLRYFQEYTIGGLDVRTLKGNHIAHGVDEYSINYLIGLPGGKTLLYACDTGVYQEETWEYLAGKRADILILECTYGGCTDRGEFLKDHLDIASFLAMLARMGDVGFIDSHTALYATHINPHQGLDHHGMQERLRSGPYHATPAYDGLRLEV
jgi:phosphoribosyl 1,2-cyclic phosphate phosphodiesterase